MNWKDYNFIALDTETTGLDWIDDRIIQLGISWFNGGEFVKTREWIINSGKSSSPEAVAVHGITDLDQLNGIDPFSALIQTKLIIPECRYMVIMNAPFDLNFLAAEFMRWDIDGSVIDYPPVLDPLVIDRFYSRNRIPALKSGARNLKALSERFGIHDYPLHSAGHDSRRVGELMIEMANRSGSLARTPLSVLQMKQRSWHRRWTDEFASYADSKGFHFTSSEWPHRRIEWPTDEIAQLPLE